MNHESRITNHESLKLGKRVDKFPNPSVDIDASFGLDIGASVGMFGGRELVPIAENIRVKVSVPWYAWLYPGAAVALPIVLGNAEDDANAMARRTVSRFVDEAISELFERIVIPPLPAGYDKHSVRIAAGGQGGLVSITYCPAFAPPVVVEFE